MNRVPEKLEMGIQKFIKFMKELKIMLKLKNHNTNPLNPKNQQKMMKLFFKLIKAPTRTQSCFEFFIVKTIRLHRKFEITSRYGSKIYLQIFPNKHEIV